MGLYSTFGLSFIAFCLSDAGLGLRQNGGSPQSSCRARPFKLQQLDSFHHPEASLRFDSIDCAEP